MQNDNAKIKMLKAKVFYPQSMDFNIFAFCYVILIFDIALLKASLLSLRGPIGPWQSRLLSFEIASLRSQ